MLAFMHHCHLYLYFMPLVSIVMLKGEWLGLLWAKVKNDKEFYSQVGKHHE